MTATDRLPRTLAPVMLRAGPVVLRFEPETLWVRDLSAGGVELLRAVYPGVRDHNWSTAAPEVQWERLQRTPRRFSLALRATYGGGRPWFACGVALDGTSNGTIRMEFTGTALRTFATNRTGLCVLHPADVAGQVCTIEHTDGSRTRARFPRAISPHQPFFDIRALSHRAPGTGRVDVRLEGDTFEMEDQRNWTDASFKTYCRPLALPAPYKLNAGDTVTQVVTVTFTPASGRRVRTASEPPRLGSRRHPLPAIGLRLTTPTPEGPTKARQLSHLPLAHLRLDLDPSTHGNLQRWEKAWRALDAFPPATGLEIALHSLPGDRGLELLARVAATHSHGRPLRWIILDRASGCTTERIWREVCRLWSRYKVPGEIGGGVRSDFVQFNRERPVLPGMEFVAFGLDPQVHAFDEASMLETLTVHATAVNQARHLSGGLPVVLSPVALGTPRTPGRSACGDSRQFTPFAAVWTLGCLAAATAARASAITLHGTAGPTGVLPPHAGQPSPLLRLLEAWTQFPATHASALAPEIRRTVCAVALHGETGTRLLVGNLCPDSQRTRLTGLPLPASQPRKRLLSAEGSARRTTRRQGRSLIVHLPGHAVVQLDFLLS